MSANGSYTHHLRDAVRRFFERGFRPIPVAFRTKKPAGGEGWNEVTRDGFNLDAEFPPDRVLNVGLLNGAPSGGLTDIDLDCVETIRTGSVLLPATKMIWGRQSAPTSHRAYVSRSPIESAKFYDPTRDRKDDGALLLEIRSDGGQSVLPPSVYGADPDKGTPEEPSVWHLDGDPAEVDADDLIRAVSRTAAAALIARYWPKRARHDISLAVSGGLLRGGWPIEDVLTFLKAVCVAANDAEMKDRLDAAESTSAKLEKEKKSTGWPTAEKLLGGKGPAVIQQVREWLGIQPELKHPSPPPHHPPKKPVRYVPVPDWKPFPVALLPEPWRGFVTAASEAVGADPAFFALPAMAVIGGAIGNTRRVALKKNWTEPPVVWAVIVGESSTLKSPALATVTDPVREVQERHIAEFQQETEAFADTLQCWLDRKKEYVKWQKADEKARKSGKRSNPDDEGMSPEDPGPRPTPPTMKRVYVADTTIERLAEILDENPRGLLIVRDELSGWLGSFTKYKGKSGATDLPNWLEMHRAGPVIVDRKTGDKKFTYVPRAACSVVGGIQPGILTRQLTPEFMASGLTARLLMAMPPVRVKSWSEAEIDEDTVAAVRRNLEALYALDFVESENDRPRAYVNKLSPEAKKLWVEFYNTWAKRQANAEGELAAAFGKIEAYAARFALLYHVVTTAEASAGTGAITAEAMRHGIDLAMWFAHETERIYQMLGESEEETELRKLVETVERLARRNRGRVTPKILQRSNQRRYRTSEDAVGALESLATAGLGRWEEAAAKPNGRKPSRAFVLCVTCDRSDETFDDEDGGDDDLPPDLCDETPDGKNDPPPATPKAPDASREPGTGSGDPSGTVSEDESLLSHVTHDVPSPNSHSDPTSGGETPPERFVTHPEVSSHTPFTLVTTAEGVNLLAGAVEDWGGPVAVDTETTGLDPTTDRVRLIQVAYGGNVSVVDVFALPDPQTALAPLFEALGTVEVTGHNLKFDIAFLARLGFVPGSVYCTMLASQVLHAGEWEEEVDDEEAGEDEPEAKRVGRLRHSLGEVAAREIGITLTKEEQLSDWSRPVLTPDQLAYAANDARYLLPLAERLKALLAEAKLTDTAALEMRALKGVTWAASVAVDAKAWAELATQAEAEQVKTAEEMDVIAPNKSCLPGAETRNWKSTPQIKEAFHALGIKLESTNDATLAALDHPLAGKVRQFRSLVKRTGTYGLKWLAEHAPTGFVYPSWNQLGAQARMSCSSPNLQQIPRGVEYRQCFIARPGCVLVKADYSQIELRAAAAIAGEAKMLEAYRDGKDLHTLTAAAITGKSVADVQKADRQLAKAVNFGLLYGMGAKSLGGYAKRKYFVTLTDEEAKKYHAAFFESYPGLKAWHARIERQLKAHIRKDSGAVIPAMTLGGRRRMIPAAKQGERGPYPNKTEHANFPVQGTAADGMKAAIALLWERRDQCPGAVPVLYIHDEIVLECPESQAEAAKDWLVTAMVEGMQPLISAVPIEVEATVGKTWGG